MKLKLLLLLALLTHGHGVSAWQDGHQNSPGVTGATTAETELLIVLVDRSSSMSEWNPPESTQAVILHYLELAALADRKLELLVITFGREVKVFGDADGNPTAAYESLAKRLIAEWPESGGGTPLDEAFERVVAVCKDSNQPTGILLLSDGEAGSGHLRPDEFPEIREGIDAKRKLILNRFRDDGPEILNESLRRYELSLLNTDSDEFKRLYGKQIASERTRTLQHAKTLHRRTIRFTTVDFAGRSALLEIHKAAGGTDEDFIRAQPDRVIEHLKSVSPASGIVQLESLEIKADPASTEHDFEIKTDPTAESVYINVEFHPAIPDFETDCKLVFEADGQTWEIDPANPSAETRIARDAKGSVATASLRLPFVPQNQTIRCRWESPTGARTLPACSVFTFFRLRTDLIPDFRPAYLPLQHQAPHEVSATQAAQWKFIIRTTDNNESFAIAAAEAVLRSGNQTIRLSMSPSPDTPGFVVGKPITLPVGVWDVELHAQTESGITLYLRLKAHIKSVLKDEAILLRFPLAASDPTLVSESRSNLAFGTFDDAVTRRTLEVMVESYEFNNPITVEFSSELADSEGNSAQGWIKFSRSRLVLRPGRPEKLRVTITVPDQVGIDIVDGLVEGAIRIRLADSEADLPIRRGENISGDFEDIPPNRVTCELKRPQSLVGLRWAYGNWVVGGSGGDIGLVRVDINHGFTRHVTIDVAHTGPIEKTISVLPSSSVVDRDGGSIAAIRFTPAEGTEIEQVVPPGVTRSWTFLFEFDENCETPFARTFVDISAEGMVTRHLPIEIRKRSPLLAGSIVTCCWISLSLLTIWGCFAWRKRRRLSQLLTDAESQLNTRRALPELLSLEVLGRGKIAIVPDIAMEEVTDNSLTRARVLNPGQTFVLRPEAINRQPLELKVVGEDDAEFETIIQITAIDVDENGEPEVQVYIVDGGEFDRKASRLTRRLIYGGLLASLLLTIAFGIHHSGVIYRLQWVRDALLS